MSAPNERREQWEQTPEPRERLIPALAGVAARLSWERCPECGWWVAIRPWGRACLRCAWTWHPSGGAE